MYNNSEFINTLSEFGEPVYLPESEGWILKRKVPGSEYFDAMGAYPIFSCKKWQNLDKDFNIISDELICFSMVTDPFGNFASDKLAEIFDIFFPFKEHFVVDLSKPVNYFISENHKRNIKKSKGKVQVELVSSPLSILDEWVLLYNNLINRHSIKGTLIFSRNIFEKQFQMHNTYIFRAVSENKTIGILIWVTQNNIAYYHLGAYSNEGYELKASFALFSFVFDFFSEKDIRFLSLGAGAGTDSKAEDGLTRFKRGWSRETRKVYFGGKIFNPSEYYKLVSEKKAENSRYFPAYRNGEFR